MKTVAICNLNFKELEPKNQYFNFSLCGKDITIGLLNDIELNSKNDLPEDSVLIKIKAFSCNYRDKAFMLLYNKMCEKANENHKCIYMPFGSEFVAEVIAIGKNVKNIEVGDRVIPDSCYPHKGNGVIGGIPTSAASQRIQCFNENQVIKIPDSMPDEVAASFTIASQTTHSIIRRLNLTKGSTVLVTAATSNTSLSAIRTLVSNGIKTYAISSNQLFEKELLDLGIHKLIQYSTLERGEVRDIEFDAIIDPFFDIYNTQLIDFLKYGGKYIFCGFYYQDILYKPFKQSNNDYFRVLAKCIVKNISLIGNCLGCENDLRDALNNFEKGKYDIVIDSIYTGDEIVPFLQKSFHSIPRFGKIVYIYDD